MSDLEQLLNELVTSAREDAMDGFEGLSLTTRSTVREIREVFTNLILSRVNPLLERAVAAAQDDGWGGTESPSVATTAALGAIFHAYDDLFEAADEA